MRNILTIFKKEFDRVITDKRLVITVFILPGFAIFMMYSLMGNALSSEISNVESHKTIVYIENEPDGFIDFVNSFDYNLSINQDASLSTEQIKDNILIGEIDLLIVFDDNFVANINDYNVPNVNTFSNSSEMKSTRGHQNFMNILYQYETSFLTTRLEKPEYINVFDIDADNQGNDIVNEDKKSGQNLAMLLPMLVVTFLFSGAMAVGPDSIAGEKERGTIATLLITPVKRSEIAIGKISSLSVLALISATSSFIGIIFSMPKLLGASGNTNINIYGASDYLMLFSVLLATVLLIVGIVSILSAFAKTVKEAGMYIMPVYLISIIIGVSTMFSTDIPSEFYVYLIPVYNTVQSIKGILTFEMTASIYLITVISNLVYVSILIFLLNKMFKSERTMFSK